MLAYSFACPLASFFHSKQKSQNMFMWKKEKNETHSFEFWFIT
jgi:hypothetical protein